MDIRFRGFSGALLRRFSAKAGSRAQERIILERLIASYVDGAIDLDRTPGQQLAAIGGVASAASLTADERRDRGRHAATARWRDHGRVP